MKKVLLFFFAALVSCSTLMAQTGGWKLAGNNLTGTEKLGSNNNFSLDFITNNVKRMSLTNKGNLRFNSDQTSIQFPNPGASPKPMMFLYESGSANTSRMVFAYSSTFPTFGLQYTLGDKIDFLGGGISALDVDLGNKRVGIGTTSPQSKLHVFNGASGTTPFSLSTLTLESSTNNYMNILAPSANETGILFGHNTNNISGGIVYNNGAASNGLQFRTNGNVTSMVLTAFGNLGIGTINPQDKIQIDDGRFTLRSNFQIPATWSFSISGGGLALDGHSSEFNKDVFGLFSSEDGSYSSASDERLKTDIRPMPAILGKISQLKPSTYRFKNSVNKQEFDGFIAQDVMKIFPSLVSHIEDKERKKDVYVLNYSGFSPIAIKGIQELMKINDSLKSEIQGLKSEMDEIKSMLQKNNQSNTSSNAIINTSLTDASLEQNAPNPFTNTTSIRYTLPQKFAIAQIIITDKSGKTIKQLNISGSGKGIINVEASSLSAGTYNYSLIVDGKIISTKQMILTK